MQSSKDARTTHAKAHGKNDPLVFVACYNRFDNLAHAPNGTPAQQTLRVYRLHRSTGTMTWLSSDETLCNPAFLRYHPSHNIMYACTEDITRDNEVAAFAVSATTGELTHLGSQSARGKSTCYLTIDAGVRHLLYVNYWDSVIGAMPITSSGLLEPAVAETLNPPQPVVAQTLADHLANRQSEPHAHAIVLDPYFARVAFVPDLGEDNIKQLVYDQATGKLYPTATLSCGPDSLRPHGPRYVEFHPCKNIAYVVNELSSTVSVFEFNAAVADSLQPGASESTLKFMQTISTIPAAFAKRHNTCGRICVDPTGRYVLVSNRGHNSITVFAIDDDSSSCGEGGKLSVVSYHHTRGRTPRHFQFDPSGEFLLTCNQDTDTITIFRFDRDTGELQWTGHVYDVPSPNFVCCRAPHPIVRRIKSRL